MFNFINKFKNYYNNNINNNNNNNNYSHDFYLCYLRYRIYNSYTSNDIINIFKNISYFYANISSDEISNIIIKCIKKYPLTENELRRFSILQQKYSNNLGIHNYTTFVLWSCIIISIDEIQKDKENNFFSKL